MKKTLFFTFLVIFIATAAITLLGMVNIVNIDEYYLRRLFYALIIELVGAVISLFKVSSFFGESKPKLSSTQKIPSGFQLKLLPDLKIDIVRGQIQDMSVNANHGAFVLPANSTFDDACIRDDRTALGSFFLNHFSKNITSIQSLIRNEASKALGVPVEKFREAPPGKTIFLDKPMGSQFRIFITAITRVADKGISADTLSLIAAVKSILEISSKHRISELCMPVLGTGHGGLDFSCALSLMLVQSVHCVVYEGCHNIKNIKIVIFDPLGEKQALIEKTIQSLEQMLRR